MRTVETLKIKPFLVERIFKHSVHFWYDRGETSLYLGCWSHQLLLNITLGFSFIQEIKGCKKTEMQSEAVCFRSTNGRVDGCATVVLLEDEDGMNASSCLCCSCDPAGGLGWPSLTSESPVKMADCVPPLLLEACVVLGASEDKLAGVCQVSSHQDDLEIVTLTGLQETEMIPHRPWLSSGAVLCSLREHKEVFSSCKSVIQINVLRFGGTNLRSCSDCAEEQKQMWWI